MSILLENHLDAVEIPANLRINDQIKNYRKKCAEMGCHRPYHHFVARGLCLRMDCRALRAIAVPEWQGQSGPRNHRHQGPT